MRTKAEQETCDRSEETVPRFFISTRMPSNKSADDDDADDEDEDEEEEVDDDDDDDDDDDEEEEVCAAAAEADAAEAAVGDEDGECRPRPVASTTLLNSCNCSTEILRSEKSLWSPGGSEGARANCDEENERERESGK